ncbi:zinc-dependent metalloprotease [Chitinophaga sp. Cy-1792]|uniref:zinc-dependent metalloprotease n=1 Tax=Chitinophaga sp. Cy-1792 TaxID=2608339 RepID=UPI0014220874|nr:zinc-dependent metalloprotease [Chitinophaga sp. Cy-1792]NIG56809.1 zinc-dependent metalloprotease [Chitinophaga sp. Cy-1792]
MSKPKQHNIVLAIAAAVSISSVTSAIAQDRKKSTPDSHTASAPAKDTSKPGQPMIKPGPKPGPKPFAEIINAQAKADSGLINIYKQDDRFFFELADSLLNRDILVVNRLSKSAAGLRSGMDGFGGDLINENVIRFEKGPNNRIFLKNISYSERSKDSTQPMFNSVMNSNLQPIVAAFDIKAFSKEGHGTIIDLTEYLNGDNDILFFDPGMKQNLKLSGYQPDKSYVSDIQSFPLNTEIRTVKTYSKAGGPSFPGMPPAPPVNVTVELNSSIVLLPKVPMQPRYFDPRVGYFTTSITDFDADPQGVKRLSMITRWRLEPKPEDLEKYKRGELVEPQKPIIFYIDPATPKKWVPYLIAGVNDWQKAFEEAGFKNAIIAKMAPTKEEDSTWSIDDARFSAIVYKPSAIPNASGPHIHDPRSGEILESHINWYHNVMRLLRNWYFIQASPNDERARKMQFSDELMGELIRFVSSHEVGHTLGLRHNFGSSSAYPVEKLRDKEWVKKNGHAASIMDYARFNYVAQPGDGISGADLYPRINYYDKWAIQWGYKLFPELNNNEDAEKSKLNALTVDKLKDKKFWFGTESDPNDPRCQNEDLGDNAMKASMYGIKNLQRIMPNLQAWTKTPNEGYGDLKELYKELVGQFNRYMGHVAKNVGGIYTTPKTVEQEGAVVEFVGKDMQKDAINFLNQQLFTTPNWLINQQIYSLTGDYGPAVINGVQDGILTRLISSNTIAKMVGAEGALGANAYKAADMVGDLKKSIFSELTTHQPVDVYRRNLQRSFVEKLTKQLVATNQAGTDIAASLSDATAICRNQLTSLRTELRAAAAAGDATTRGHYQDLIAQISKTLDNK